MSTARDLRRQADRFLHHWTTEVGLLCLILISVALTVVEVAMRPGLARSIIEGANDGLTALFVVELSLRYWVAKKKRRFFARYWIDILAVLPPVRPLRVFRVLRVFRLYRAGVLLNRRMSVFNASFRGTAAEMFALSVGSLVLLLITSMMLFLAEGDSGVFRTFEDAVWFASFSLIAGEPIGPTPVTELGRWTTLFLMIGGIGLFGVFVGTVSAGVAQRLSANLGVQVLDLDELSGHVIVCGWNKSGPTVLKELFAPATPPGRAVVVVTESSKPPEVPREGVRVEHLYHHHGDYTQVDVLEAVGIREAAVVILLTDEIVPRSPQDRDARTVLAALTVERMAPQIYTVAELHSRQNEDLLRMAGVEEIVVGDWYAGMILGTIAANRGLVAVLDEILTAAHGNTFRTVDLPETWVGRSVADLHNELFVRHRAVLVSVENPPRNVVVNPDPDRLLRAGDRLVVLCGDDFRDLE